jgi:hypothetical protein
MSVGLRRAEALCEELIERSNAFERTTRVSFPTTTNRLSTLVKSQQLSATQVAEHAASVRIGVLARLLPSIDAFLEWKRSDDARAGSAASRAFFKRNVPSSDEFLIRLVRDRPLAFLTRHDQSLLRNGMGMAGDQFVRIGTESEDASVKLGDYIGYDEMLFSALVVVSSRVAFINDGARDNCARPGPDGSFEPEGVCIGAVGARFEREDLMESLFVLVDQHRSTEANGYGAHAQATGRHAPLCRLFAPVYNVPHFPSWGEASADKSGRFVALRSGRLFDTAAFAARIRLTIDTILLEANSRAQEHGSGDKKAHVRMCGFGLGVWAASKAVQSRIFVEQVEQSVAAHNLRRVGTICMMYFDDAAQSGRVHDGATLKDKKGHSVRIVFGNVNQAAPVAANELLVTTFAWDGNSFVGNEFWMGMLAASGDPAAACCSTIPEIQNPHINHYLTQDKCIRCFVDDE